MNSINQMLGFVIGRSSLGRSMGRDAEPVGSPEVPRWRQLLALINSDAYRYLTKEERDRLSTAAFGTRFRASA